MSDNSSRGSGGNSRGNGRGGGGGSGWYNKWKWRGRGGGGGRGFRGNLRGRGRGQGGNSEVEFEDRQGSENSNGSHGAPPPSKRRRTASSIKESVVAQWKKKLPGYCLYYPDAAPQLPEMDKKISIISDYLHREGYVKEERLLAIEDQEYFEVSCENITLDAVFIEGWPQFIQDLNENPAEVVNLWGAVMHKMVHDFLKNEGDEIGLLPLIDGNKEASKGDATSAGYNISGFIGVARIHAGLMKLEPITPLIKINSSSIGKFVTIRGAIVGTGTVRPVCLQLAFLCRICETEFVVNQPYGLYTPPTKCGVSEECSNKNQFEPVETSDSTLMMDSRKIRIQDMQNPELERGTVPRTIDCELTHGMVHKCNTGDAVTITGIVKMKKEVQYKGEQSLHDLYIEAIGMKNHKESERTMGGHWFSFSNIDYCAIGHIHDTKNLFRLMVASLCPSIYGHELVKAALILSLFGGAASDKDELLSRRDDINILMVGDPGIGKSQMLKVVAEVAPRAVYVCGTGSTVAGLTVTLVREGDEFSLEAGALIMGDRGVCCIDEFDKMQNQHPALLEAMEQQSISIAKSGVFRTLPARTTVIAASNPVGGHYNKLKSINENIKISSALLSRFDVVFILLDKPDKDFDQKIVEHIMGAGSSRGHKKANKSDESPSSSRNDSNISGFAIPLRDRLKLPMDELANLIPHHLMRKYIAYARQYVKPKISREAGAILKEYYLRLRVKHRMADSTPVTTRQLESLVRLTEAKAKVELRETATADDANDVLEIFESSLSSAFDDDIVAVSALSESILLSSQRPSGGTQVRSQAKQLVSSLQKVADQQSKNIFSVNEIKATIRKAGLKASPESLISLLNNEGYLIKKGGDIYKLTVSDY